MRGKKKCPSCGTISGVRLQVCKTCGHKFVVQKSTRRKRRPKQYIPCEDWRRLKKNDIIKVIQGSGPYYICEESQEKIHLNSHGVFQVKEILKDGILAYSTKELTGIHYIYMDEQERTMHSGAVYTQHKILCKNTNA